MPGPFYPPDLDQITLGGNTEGIPIPISTGTLQFDGGANVTLSQNGNTLVFRAGGGGGGVVLSAGTQEASSGTVLFADSNGLTFGMSDSTRITGSYSQSTHSHSAFVLSESNSISFGTNGSTVTASFSQSTHAHTEFVFSNSNGVSFGTAGSTVTATVKTDYLTTAMASNAATISNIRVSAGTLSNLLSRITFADGNRISFGLDGSTLTGSVASSLTAIKVSGGTLSNLLSALTFSDANGVSFGLDGSTLTASVAPGGGGLTNIRISGGTTSNLLSALTFADSNGVSFGLNASTMTATVKTDYLTSQSIQYLAITLGGNTAGTTTFHASNNASIHIHGGNNITLSGNNLSSFTIIGPNPGAGGGATLSFWQNMEGESAAFPRSTLNITNIERTFVIQPLELDFGPFKGNMTVSTMLMPVNLSGSTATMSLAYSSSFSFGFYTLNAGTLSLVNSASISIGSAGAATNNSTLYAGIRWLTVHSSLFSSSPVFSAGVHYWWGFAFRSSAAFNQTFSVFGQNLWASNTVFVGTIGAASVANNTTRGIGPFYGIYSATSNAVPASIGSNQLNKQVAAGVLVPHLVFNNVTASF
jgi:hypothetical protein